MLSKAILQSLAYLCFKLVIVFEFLMQLLNREMIYIEYISALSFLWGEANCQRVRPSGRPEGLTRRQIIEPREDMYTRKKSQKRSKV